MEMVQLLPPVPLIRPLPAHGRGIADLGFAMYNITCIAAAARWIVEARDILILGLSERDKGGGASRGGYPMGPGVETKGGGHPGTIGAITLPLFVLVSTT